MDKGKNILIVVLIVVIIGLVGVVAFYLGKSGKIQLSPVEKNISTNEALVRAFAAKLNKDLQEVTVTITKEIPGFAQGGIKFADVAINSGANFFAAEVKGKWEIVWFGDGNYACEELERYAFPVEFMTGCTRTSPVPSPQPAVNNNDANIAGIKQAFATKYDKSLNIITVNITQQSGNYFRGNVRFSDAEINSGAMFLSRKVGNNYEIVVDGHGTYTCDEVAPLGFPQQMISDCSR
jgi:hypothetical protein